MRRVAAASPSPRASGLTPAGRLPGWVRRVDAATPADRDRGADGLRALAILGVVLGHWLVTALVADSGTLRVASPLRHLPWLAPVSWIFQTMALFFLVGGWTAAAGHASARARGDSYGRWLRRRMARLCRPLIPLAAVWGVAVVVMLASGADVGTVRALAKLVWSPLWFLLVFAVLTAATPVAVRLSPVWPLAVVAGTDLVRFGLDGPAWVGWVNVAAGWLVPYCLGASWAGGRMPGRWAGWALLIGGAAVTALLVLRAGYPASMVGVPGARVSNQSPPTLAAVTFGLAQSGAALLLLGPLRRALSSRPVAWAVVALANLSAMTIYLWHQTAMIAVTGLGMLAGTPLPGLHTVPGSAAWVAARLAWLPVFGGVLVVYVAVFRSAEGRAEGRSVGGRAEGRSAEGRAAGRSVGGRAAARSAEGRAAGRAAQGSA
ncbi:acyltransferase [Nonomuraea sp. SMC257]|uniref:Acyltransferase n=1 Tax=Nonomuraea montanisoli TaxID=2741721 RepID=A0A7Y6M8H9_9ACTN|nr:acyltransferase [Nonomuraea montanisoli]